MPCKKIYIYIMKQSTSYTYRIDFNNVVLEIVCPINGKNKKFLRVNGKRLKRGFKLDNYTLKTKNKYGTSLAHFLAEQYPIWVTYDINVLQIKDSNEVTVEKALLRKKKYIATVFCKNALCCIPLI